MEPLHTMVFECMEYKPLKKFLATHGVSPVPRSKEEARQKIMEKVDAGEIGQESLIQWIEQFYREGNKHIYIYDIDPVIVERLQRPGNITNLLNDYRVTERIRPFSSVDRPERPVLIHHEIITNEADSPSIIEFGYVQKGQLRVIDNDTDTIQWHPINYYVLVEVDLNNGQIRVRLEPTKYLKKLGDDFATLSQIAGKFKTFVSTILGLQTIDNQILVRKALYKLWVDSTIIDDPEIQKLIAAIEPYSEAFMAQVQAALNLSNTETRVSKKEILTMLEGLLIAKNELSCSHGPGVVRKQKLTDRSGAIFQGTAKGSMETTDLHLKTRAYVDGIGELFRLDFAWTGQDEDGTPINTIIESVDDYLEITFLGYNSEDDMNYVLSRIRDYCNNLRDQQGDN